MIDTLRWLIAIEIIGLAFLPLAMWLLRGLPDRGYAFSRVFGLLLTTFGLWFIGSFFATGTMIAVPIVIVLIVGTISWWVWWRATVETVLKARGVILIEEALFLIAFVVWSILRVYIFHSAIAHTEQFMDMALLNTALGSARFPPADLWMSGHTVNYYYLGYLMAATVTRLSGVAPTVGYNLTLSMLFALVVSGAYSLGYCMTGKRGWALLAPLFLALLGNWHAIAIQIPHGQLPGNTTWWFWDSTRVIGSASDYTINEFPFFSFMLGDLHPHVMALPVTLLAIATAISALRAPQMVLGTLKASWGRLALMGLCVGSLYAINSWDFPTYGLVIALSLGAGAYASNAGTDWWKAPLTRAVAVGIAGVALFAPFYLHFRSLAHGIGLVTTRTDPGDFIQIFGLFLLGALLLVGSLAVLLQPADEGVDDVARPSLLADEAGALDLGRANNSNLALGAAVLLALVIGLIAHALVLVFVLLLGIAAAMILERVLNTESPNLMDAGALILVIVACAVLAFTEVGYLRDSFDGGGSYRMNTVFKFYYQAWTLLGLVAAYGIWRGRDILGRYLPSTYVWCVVALLGLGVAGAGAYTVLAPQSVIQPDYGAASLDGMAWLQSQHPGDYGAIRWLQDHVQGRPVELEAVGSDYQYFARISTFAGLPTVMGWAGHEDQWRPGDPDVAARANDVRTIYTTRSVSAAERLLHMYGVRFVIVGDPERSAYGTAGLSKFARFMHVVFQGAGTTVYSW